MARVVQLQQPLRVEQDGFAGDFVRLHARAGRNLRTRIGWDCLQSHHAILTPQAVGINPAYAHAGAFAIGTAIAGLAGGLWAHYLGVIKPVDMSRGNHKIFSTVNNRGNDALLNATSVAPGSINELYLRLGYVIVDIGWEGDIAPSSTRLVANLPIASNADGSPIVGPMRIEYSDFSLPLAR